MTIKLTATVNHSHNYDENKGNDHPQDQLNAFNWSIFMISLIK